MPRTSEQAIAYCASHLNTEPDGCQKEVRVAYGVPSDGTPSASADWAKSKRKHPTGDPMSIPRGAIVRWTGGSHGYGHVAVCTGNGMCWSTDLPTRGRRGLIPISAVHAAWGLTLVGWTEDIDGVQVYFPPAPRKPKPRRPAPVRAAIKAVSAAIKSATGTVQKKREQKAKASLKDIKKR